MPKLKELWEARAKAAADLKAIVTEGGEGSDFEARYNAANEVFEKADNAFQIQMKEDERESAGVELEERFRKIAAKRPGNRDAEENETLQSAMQLRDQFRDVLEGRSRGFDITPRVGAEYEKRNMLKGGANPVPTPDLFYNTLYETLQDTSSVRSAGARVLTTTDGNVLELPRVTAHMTAAWTGEAVALTKSEPTVGSITLSAFKAGAYSQISYELLDDDAFGVAAFLARDAGEALGLLTDTAYMVGDGTGKPTGMVAGLSAGKTGAVSATPAVTYDDLVDMQHSITRPYRRNARWLMNDGVIKIVRKLKDDSNMPIWQPSVQMGEPDVLLGKGVHTHPDLAAPAAGASSFLYGDFSRAYVIRDVRGVRVERSDDFAFTTDLATWKFVLRTDGKLIDTAAARRFVHGAAS
jgi:HK97 family phage major capsid protein